MKLRSFPWSYFTLLSVILLAGFVHFHDREIFSRKLIRHDDHVFIQPLEKLGVASYFTEWLPKKDHYAFPLRDMTFLLDFKLSQWVGMNTFWFSNFLFFALTLFFLFRVFRRLMPEQPLWGGFLLGWVALHPLQVEAIQWASVRKHILVALFLAAGTDWVVRIARAPARGRRVAGKAAVASRSDRVAWVDRTGVFLVGIFGCYVASLLCWPTGFLWIFWALFMVRDRVFRSRKGYLQANILGAVLCGLYLFLVVSRNSDYSSGAGALSDPGQWGRSLYFGWRTVGRGFFNVVAPVRLAAYYFEGSPLNVVGLILFLAATGWFARSVWRTCREGGPGEAGWLSLAFFGLFLLLLLPQCTFIFGNTEFVLADRYFHVPLPYLTLGLGLWAGPRMDAGRLPQWIRAEVLIPLGLGILVFFVFLGARNVPYWNDALKVMQHCSDKEQAYPCFYFMVEKKFNEGGCATVIQDLLAGRQRLKKNPPAYQNNVLIDMPLFDSFCAATVQMPMAERRKAFEEIKALYPNSTAMVFSEVLVILATGTVDEAFALARNTYLNPQNPLSDLNKTVSNVLRGQVSFFCQHFAEKPELAKQKGECDVLNRFLNQRIVAAPYDMEQISWGYGQSLRAFQTRL